ncbi:TIGR04053 family radical SAM/SPASM domain-containing protein [Desulfosporosinus meridiei]|uniref:Radical SAM protein, BA_1875 family n=1 Tax=Desulfosporosinus meridiei (strain ATCC BAA-275 / DSM 13257 / KCTC 12902 / NCIMB 13706 / S10) TaxID=768704 RepID=J7IXR6_DESMD|nr:TIGR04053 family radical SAM/SPASM domain-containing protein [Desulfosporosinus meridiei]AFQ43893.1 radical SAM protein, BA_1875 family [Desulfosporosinus meridiei DSM 13257]
MENKMKMGGHHHGMGGHPQGKGGHPSGHPGMNVDYNKNPFIVIWETTRACGLKCQHCRADAQPDPHPEELTHEQGIALIDEIYEMDNPMLVFTGGDCMLRKDLFELADYGIKKGMRVSMSPSATVEVTKERMDMAKEVGISRWSFSIDGADAKTHDAFRGIDGTFDLTIEKLKYLNEIGISHQINTCINKANLHQLEQMAELMKELKTSVWYILMMIPTGRASLDDCITAAQHEEVFKWLYELSKNAPYDIKTTAGQHYRRVVFQQRAKENGTTGEEITFEGTKTRDMAQFIDGLARAPKAVNDGNGFIFVSHTGDVTPSGFLPLVVGNVKENRLRDIYRESPILRDLRSPDKYEGKCGICEYNKVCGGSRARAYGATGNYMASEPFCVYIPEKIRKK